MSTYVVTGATRGIGREVVQQLRDHDLVLVGRDAQALTDVAATLPHATTVVLDLEHPETFAVRPHDPTESAWPERIDGVVHSAGVAARVLLRDGDPALWQWMLTVNVVAVAELTRLLLPALRAAHGTVVLVNSGQGLAAAPASTAYAASKHALRALADGLRQEEPDLRVISIYPGRVDTEMQRELRRQEAGAYEPEHYLRASTVAAAVVDAFRLPDDAVVTDLRLMPRRP